jgi:hypothetical protein
MVAMQLEHRDVRRLNGGRPLHSRERRPRALWSLLTAMGFLSIGGFVGGVSFVVDRTGAGLGMKVAWLEQTPVSDYLLPGVFLLAVYAIGSLVLMAGLTWRWSPGPLAALDRRLGYHWSWAGTIVVGAVLVGWIIYQFTVIPGVIALQPIMIVAGVVMVAIPLLPSVRRHYRTVAYDTAAPPSGPPCVMWLRWWTFRATLAACP